MWILCVDKWRGNVHHQFWFSHKLKNLRGSPLNDLTFRVCSLLSIEPLSHPHHAIYFYCFAFLILRFSVWVRPNFAWKWLFLLSLERSPQSDQISTIKIWPLWVNLRRRCYWSLSLSFRPSASPLSAQLTQSFPPRNNNNWTRIKFGHTQKRKRFVFGF